MFRGMPMKNITEMLMALSVMLIALTLCVTVLTK